MSKGLKTALKDRGKEIAELLQVNGLMGEEQVGSFAFCTRNGNLPGDKWPLHGAIPGTLVRHKGKLVVIGLADSLEADQKEKIKQVNEQLAALI